MESTRAGIAVRAKGKGKLPCHFRRNKKRTFYSNVSKGAIRRLARRGGVKRISALVYDSTRDVLRLYLEKLVRDSILYCEYFKRKTVLAEDVIRALKCRGQRIYGFDERPFTISNRSPARLEDDEQSTVPEYFDTSDSPSLNSPYTATSYNRAQNSRGLITRSRNAEFSNSQDNPSTRSKNTKETSLQTEVSSFRSSQENWSSTRTSRKSRNSRKNAAETANSKNTPSPSLLDEIPDASSTSSVRRNNRESIAENAEPSPNSQRRKLRNTKDLPSSLSNTKNSKVDDINARVSNIYNSSLKVSLVDSDSDDFEELINPSTLFRIN